MPDEEEGKSGRRMAARRMSHRLILALVVERPGRPHEIWRRYESRFGSFGPKLACTAVPWVLWRLADAGYINTMTPVDSFGERGSLVVYRATAAGDEAHKQWLLSKLEADDWRRELLARISTGATLGREALSELMGLYRAEAWEHLRRVQPVTDTESDTAGGLACLAAQCVADEQAAVIGAQLAWVEGALEILRDTSTRDAT